MRFLRTKKWNEPFYRSRRFISSFWAEKEGFEPSRRFSRPTPFPGEPLRPLGYFSKKIPTNVVYVIHTTQRSVFSGEDGIRTHVPVRTNGFQDRLVMTASIPLRIVFVLRRMFCLARTNDILAKRMVSVNKFFGIFLKYFYVKIST